MTALANRRYGCAGWLGHRSSFNIGGLGSGHSGRNRCWLLAGRCLGRLGLGRIGQRIVLLLARSSSIGLLRRAREKRHLARHQKCACHDGSREAFESATYSIHLRTPQSLSLGRSLLFRILR